MMEYGGDMLEKKDDAVAYTCVDYYPYDTINGSSMLHNYASYLTHLSFIYPWQLGFWLLSRSCRSFSAHKKINVAAIIEGICIRSIIAMRH